MDIEQSNLTIKDPLADLNGIAIASNSNKVNESKVHVALRVRRLISKEVLNREQRCVDCYPITNQISMGKDRTFTFDSVFDENAKQGEVYEKCAKDLVLSCLAGYNTTILAYGQTGSGKTYTMGSNATYHVDQDEDGIIPRVMREIFTEINKRAQKSEFIVKVSFLEIYNEEIQDLLDETNSRIKLNSNMYSKNPITIREEKDGSISVYGINEEKVNSYEDMVACLERGSLHRATASTLMNETSSRSHAIFSISIEQHQIEDLYSKDAPEKKPKSSEDAGFTTAKFHFVDLAGSERLKRTGASGSVLKEGISINRGLLALGNVISALTDDTGKVTHIPYRDSKLTRMLQDSLGGNSRTVMIACVSPAESNFDESLNTLKYAQRARNIRNKPVVNRDPQSTIISQLKQQVFELQNELMAYKRSGGSGNFKDGTFPNNPNHSAFSNMFSGKIGHQREENNLQEDVKMLKIKLFQNEKELVKVRGELQQTKMSLGESQISMYSLKKERDLLKMLQEKYRECLDRNHIQADFLNDSQFFEIESKNLVDEYLQKIDKLQKSLEEKQESSKVIQHEYDILVRGSHKDHELLLEKTKLIQSLTSQLKKQKALNKKLQQQSEDSAEPNVSHELGMAQEAGNQTLVNENVHEVTKNDEESDSEDINEEDEMLDHEFEVHTQAAREEIMLVTGTLNEKEELLDNITQGQLLLERNLVDEMKHQYYEKIIQLEDELKHLEKQKDEAISKVNVNHADNERNKNVGVYKQKIADMDAKIKEFKKKEKEQQNMLKLVKNQRTKIEQLDGEIKKIRVQKTQLQKKMREEAERFNKMRNTRQKELMDAKKKNIEKDAIITKLKTENRKKELMYKKKAEELLSRCMSKELLKQIDKNRSSANSSRMNSSRKSLETQSSDSKADIEESKGLVSEVEVKNLVDYCTEKLTEHLKLSLEIEKEENNLTQTEEDLENEKNKYSQILLTRDKLEIDKRDARDDIELENNLDIKIQEYELELNEIYTRVENLEEKRDFRLNKVKGLTNQLSQKPSVNAEQLLMHNTKINYNTPNYQTILRCLFGKHISSNLEILRNKEELSHLAAEFSDIKKRLDESEQRAKFTELQYEINLTKLNKEYEKNQLLLIQNRQDDENSAEDTEIPGERGFRRSQTARNITNKDFPFEGMVLETLDSMNSTRNPGESKGENSETPSFMRQIRHKRAVSGNDVHTHSRDNSVKTIDSPTNKQDRTLGFPKRGGGESFADQNKRLERTVSDMAKKQQSSDKIIETLRRKCEVLQGKYDQFKKQNAKEKFIGVNRPEDADNMNLSLSNMIVTNESTMNPMQTSSLSPNNDSRGFERSSSMSKQEKTGTDGLGSINLMSLRDKRKEEKQKFKFNKQITTEDLSSLNGNLPHEAGTKRKTAMPSPINNFKVASTRNSNTAKTFPFGLLKGGNNCLQLSKRSSSPVKSVDDKMLSELTGRESVNQGFPDQKGPESMPPDFFMNEKENLDNRNFDDTGSKSIMDYNNKSWKCYNSTETQHSGGVYSMVSAGNTLYTSGNKTLKIWSLDRMTCLGELNAHPAAIKSLAIWQERGLLVSACDKVISLWDLKTLQNVATLKGHKDEIKALHVSNNLLISAGKGSTSSGAIFTWDLKSLSPVDEKERNQEVFCLASNNNVLYYGSRNHQVRRVNLLTMESLTPFDPPHYDAVTSMAVVKDHLISGSRDKNLRLWGLDQTANNLKHTSYAHQDWINVIEANSAKDMIYSGSRDGSIKIWSTANKKLRCLSDINGHSQSVTSICKINEENEAMFVTASLDRSVKLWKPVSDDISEISAFNPLKGNDITSPGLKLLKLESLAKNIPPRSAIDSYLSSLLNIEKQ